MDPAHENQVCLSRLGRMIFEILVWLSAYVLHHTYELRIVTLVCGGVFLSVQLNTPSNKLRPLSTRQALCQALRVARSLYSLFVAAAFVIVSAALLLVVG